MKVLVICQYYDPEPFRISDICEDLVQKGHDVVVVTGTPNYPMGEIYNGYEDGQRADEMIRGVSVHRCKITPRKTGTWNRFKNYLSYAYTSRKYIKMLPGDFDVVFVYQLSPVLMAEAGMLYKKMHKKRLIIYCMDLWPESLCAGGVKKGSLVYKIFRQISKRIYCSADQILVTSKMFQKYLKEMFAIPESKIEYLPQYAESQFLNVDVKQQQKTFSLLFAGNIGVAQNVKTIIETAVLLREENVCFHIVGDGIELNDMMKCVEGLSNIFFYGRKPLEEMPRYYEMADAMLVTLIDEPVMSMTLPGKVQSYMAAGKPIVGAINGETALILNEVQGGYCAPAGDAEQLAKCILELRDSGRVKEIGQKNQEYYLKNFAKEKFMDGLVQHLMK